MRPYARALGAVVGAIALLAPVSARAANGAVWWVESTCEPAGATFEREVTLACEAVGGTCRVASQKSDAELVARIDCSSGEGPWVLETQTVEGKPLGRLELDGAEDDRLREAAMEVARDAAPERSLAVEALKSNLSDADGKPRPPSPPVLSFAASGLATVRPSETDAGGLVGGRGMFGLHLHDTFQEVVSFSYAFGTAASPQQAGARVARGGVGFAFGAPFTNSWIGTTVEVGVDHQESSDAIANTSTGAPNAFTPPVGYRDEQKTGAYVQDTLYLMVPTRTLRPFAALTAGFVTTVKASFDAQLGVALAVF